MRNDLVLVIIRQLPNHRPATLAVIEKPDNISKDDFRLSREIREHAQEIIDKFKTAMPEFNDAEFYYDYVETTWVW